MLPPGDSLYTTNLSPPFFSRISLSVALLIAALAFLSRHTPFKPPRSYASTPSCPCSHSFVKPHPSLLLSSLSYSLSNVTDYQDIAHQ